MTAALRPVVLVAAVVLTAAVLGARVAPPGAAGVHDRVDGDRRPAVVLWPVPLPDWFWGWARWYLGRGEFAEEARRSVESRPAPAPPRIPGWAWRRLRLLLGQEQRPTPDAPLELGDRSEAVWLLQRTLRTTGYPVGPLDGIFGEKTRAAVIAHQKVHRRELDGVVQPDEYVEILRSKRPRPKVAGAAHVVLVDISRQVLFDVRDGRVRQVLPVSTGGGYEYTGLDGERHVATTPRGSYEVFRTVEGWDTSYLGRLYYPIYFVGGYAIHGSSNVPIRAVSHGCIRIPLWHARAFQREHPVGTRIVIVG